MKKIFFLGLCIVFCSLFNLMHAQSNADKNGYEIKIRIKGYTSGKLFLAHYAGEKTYIADSGFIDKQGWSIFKGPKPLQCGIYILALDRVKLFEFLVKEQKFSLLTDTVDMTRNMKVVGSPENEIFMSYQIKAGEIGTQSYYLRERYKAAEKSGDTKKTAILKDSLIQFGKDERAFYKKIITEKPNSLLAKIMNAMQEVEIPAGAKNEKGQLIDTSRLYQQYLIDYWKNVDFSCECLAYTPVYLA
ncbi:MAG: DUF4369 domain-containing protein, partial [Bacteroidetes bacterium]|nr:DUF4369 domain-containing protein [Bacteroidota bacterium]